ncbi:MAG: hypothetical protein OXC12_17705 [Spirochaetaceae bacterium]|nr:hypothetical protein [Spirochaetaceae bacterium]
MTKATGRRPFSTLGDQHLLEQTKRLVANQRVLEVHILDHLDEIDRRNLALRRGFSSLFDYTIIGYICKSYNGLLVTKIFRYCFRNPLVVYDHPLIRFGLACDTHGAGHRVTCERRQPGSSSATAARTSLSFLARDLGHRQDDSPWAFPRSR